MSEAKKIIDEVLDAYKSRKMDGVRRTVKLREAAPILAKMLQKAIEQRDGWVDDVGMQGYVKKREIEYQNAELDRIVAEGLGEKWVDCDRG